MDKEKLRLLISHFEHFSDSFRWSMNTSQRIKAFCECIEVDEQGIIKMDNLMKADFTKAESFNQDISKWNATNSPVLAKSLIMKEIIRLIWQCEECKDVVISYSHLRHDMNYCECGKSAVALEEHHRRGVGKVKDISRKKSVDGKWVNVC